MITPAEARKQAAAFLNAAEESPMISIAAVLRERGKEYERAASDCELAESMGKKAIIMMVGSVEAGLVVMNEDEAYVLRVIRQSGDISLQVKDRGHLQYMNFVSTTSPVVVLL